MLYSNLRFPHRGSSYKPFRAFQAYREHLILKKKSISQYLLKTTGVEKIESKKLMIKVREKGYI